MGQIWTLHLSTNEGLTSKNVQIHHKEKVWFKWWGQMGMDFEYATFEECSYGPKHNTKKQCTCVHYITLQQFAELFNQIICQF